MKIFFVLHRYFFSPMVMALGIHCRYEETCSRYAERVLKENGFIKGAFKAFVRVLSC